MTIQTKDDLALIGVRADERRKLESMGFITLEQIVLLDVVSLGMGKSRGDVLIQSAKNILANKHIREINIEESGIIVRVDKMDEAVKKSVCGVLNAVEGENGNCIVETEMNKIDLYAGKNPHFSFESVFKNAKVWGDIISAKQKREFENKGITLGENKIRNFAKERGGFEGFWKDVFSEIKGNDIIKKALTVALFSDFDEPVHILIIGDPGSCKTLAKEIVIQNFQDVSAVGANATRSGLVFSMASGQAGVLAYSDNKIVTIDEFDKIPEHDIEYCYELLSNGKCSVHSARFHQDILSRFIMIALGNPIHGIFKGRPIEEIGLPPTLLSRFAFIIKTEKLSIDDRHELFYKKFYAGSAIQRLPQYYNEWIKLARMYKPEIKVSDKKLNNYIKEVNEKIVEEYYGTNLRRDIRMGDYIRRIPISIARVNFSDVTDETLDLALKLIKEGVDTWKWV